MNHSPDEKNLRDALESFETCLATPVISGDLVEWANYLQTAWNKAEPEVRHHVHVLFRGQLDQISNVDPELLGHVAQLRSESDAILKQAETLGQDISRLAEKASRLEQHENRAEPDWKAIIDSGIEFVTRVRRQLVAIQAWLVEALNRQRGPGD